MQFLEDLEHRPLKVSDSKGATPEALFLVS
jgi:hypothetical protein